MYADKDSMGKDIELYYGIPPYDTVGNVLQGDQSFLRFLEARYDMKLDDMLKMCGLENAEMSDMAKIKSHLVVKCINCGNKMRVNDIRTHPPSPLMEVLVAPCGMCLKRFVGEQEE